MLNNNNNRLGDGGRAIGTTGVSHCVGVYIELEDGRLEPSHCSQMTDKD